MGEQLKYLLREDEISRACKTSNNLYFGGSPQIGKTTLVKSVVNQLRKSRNRCPIEVEWDTDWTASWIEMLLQINLFFIEKVQVLPEVARLVEQYREPSSDRTKFFEELESRFSTQVLLVMDDLDSAERSYDPHGQPRPGSLTPIEVVGLGTLPSVRLVATGRFPISNSRLGRFFDLEEWLLLPPRNLAEKYTQERLEPLELKDQDKVASLIITWAGYHPFLLESLLDRIPPKVKEVEGIVAEWKASADVQSFLKEVLAYLEWQVSKESEIRIVLRRVLDDTLDKSLSTNEQILVHRLRQCALVDAKGFDIPSKLVYQELRRTIVSSRWWHFTGERLFGLAIYSMLLSTVLMLILGLVGKKPVLGALPMLLPVVYGIYGLFVLRHGHD